MKNVKKNLLLIGAGAAGRMVISEIKENPVCKYNIIGIIDDEPSKTGELINGYKVLGSRKDIIKICKNKNVEVILLAIPSIKGSDKIDILNICSATSCEIKILPSISEIIDKGNLKYSLRNLRIEDLLARDPIVLNNEKISEYITNKVILVTGGGGSIGSELCRQISKYNPAKIIVFDIYENNAYDLQNELSFLFPKLNVDIAIGSVRDKERLNNVFLTYRPDIVFHAAAHKHVPLMESNPAEAVKNNVFGTFNTAKCAIEHNVNKFVLISTDKAVNPTNVMGATKRLCEMVVQSLNNMGRTEFSAVRFGNVLGSNGSVVNLFKNQIKNGGPVTITHKDITRYFMTIPEAAQLVLEAASYAKGGEIYVLDMGSPVKIFDLAINMIKLSGLQPFKDIQIKITGLRSGEKLYEELLMDEEEVTEKINEKIFIARPVKINTFEFEKGLAKLQNVAKIQDPDIIKRTLAELVKSYKYDTKEEKAQAFAFSNVDEVVGIKDIKSTVTAKAY